MSPYPVLEPKRPIWKRSLLGGVLMIAVTAAATALLAFHEIDEALPDGPPIPVPVDPAAAGNPQTILLLGSDKRAKTAKDATPGDNGRSDTIMLVRLDPDSEATHLLSLPRDLKVPIPGHGSNKINAAYEFGGPALTVRTVKALMGVDINHVVNVDFQGFKKAIDAIGCIYADIDRGYFNDSAAYAYIKVPAGYQRLCGEPALEYARFRHEDTDLVRGVRQQSVLAAVKQQVSAGDLLGDRGRLTSIFSRYTTSDADLKTKKGAIRLLKLAVFSAGHPVEQVPFEGQVGPSYVTASPAQITKLRRQFLGEETAAKPRRKAKPRQAGPRDAGLEKAPVPGKDQAVRAIAAGAGGRLPVYYPTVQVRGATFFAPPRVYRIKTPSGAWARSYRMVIARGLAGEYYGVQGTTWKNPPILDGDADKVKAKGREFELRYDGDRVQTVAWRTKKGAYWVSNTLKQSLSKDQMLAIARSTRLP